MTIHENICRLTSVVTRQKMKLLLKGLNEQD